MKGISCPICSDPLSIRIARGRKSNKPFIMLKCDRDGRHFRGFITDQEYVNKVLHEVESKGSGTGVGTVRDERERLIQCNSIGGRDGPEQTGR